MGIVISLLSMAFYIVETALQINDAATNPELWTSVAIACFIVGALVTTNVVSAILVLRTMDFSGKKCGKFICLALHCGQLGLIWRYLKLFMLYDERDWKEFVLLRIIQTLFQSIPYTLMKGYLMVSSQTYSTSSICTTTVSIIASGLVFTMFNLGNLLFESDEFLEKEQRIKKSFGIFFLTLGTIFLILSRCGAIILMSSVLTFWISIPIGIHFIASLVISLLVLLCNKRMSVKTCLKIPGIAIVNLFDMVVSEFKRIKCHLVLYYSAILVENIIMDATWMILTDGEYVYKLTTVVLLLGTFVFGIILKSCSCGYIEIDEYDDSLSDDVFSYHKTENGTIPKELPSVSKNVRRNGDVNQLSSVTASEIQIESIFTPISDQFAINNDTRPKTRSRSSKSSANGSHMLMESNGDIASSNSRNTNTLNVSNRSNKQNTDNELLAYNERARKSAMLSPNPTLKVKPLTVKDSPRNANIVSKSPQIKKYSMGKKIDIPLFPQECNDLIGSKEFGSPKSKHVLSNSVAEYHMDETESDTSYSEYLSYSSYYLDSTDWSSVSGDSDCAMTWPPSNPVTFVNLHSLPKERIETTDSVRVWLSRLDEWEPSYEVDGTDFLNEINNTDITHSLQNSEEEKKDPNIFRRSSSVHEQKTENSSGKRNKVVKQLSNFFSRQKRRDSDDNRHHSGEFNDQAHSMETDHVYENTNNPDAFIIWQEDSPCTPDLVQESVV